MAGFTFPRKRAGPRSTWRVFLSSPSESSFRAAVESSRCGPGAATRSSTVDTTHCSARASLPSPDLRAEPPSELFNTSGPASNTHAHYDVTVNDEFVMRWERLPLDRQRIHVVTNLFDQIETLSVED